MVSENARVKGKIPELFLTLLWPQLEKLEEVISPGLTLLSWNSLNIEYFLDTVHKALKELELLVDRACDLLELRIEGVLKEIQATPLCELPDSDPWTVHQFVSKTQVRSECLVATYMVCVNLVGLYTNGLCVVFPVLVCALTFYHLTLSLQMLTY